MRRNAEHGDKRAKAPTPRRSLWSRLRGAGAAAQSIRRASQGTFDLDPLKPQGATTSSPSASGARGADATTPQEIPPRGWFEIAKPTAKKFSENELMSEAASVTFFALLSLFPAITALVSIFGLFADPATIRDHLADAARIIPSGGMEIIEEQVKRLTQTPSSGLSFDVSGMS